MNCDIREDFLYSVFKIILHKMGNIANVFSVNIEACLSSSFSDFSKQFIYRMRNASLSLNSFIDFMRVFLEQNIDSIKFNDFWEKIVSLIFSKNKNLSVSNILNIKNTFFRAISVILISMSGSIKNIEEKNDILRLDFCDIPDNQMCVYLDKKGINYKKEGNSIFINL
ncbi:MAG TPA: hypothetical protein PKW55_00365 [Spirochaetota bacterium]|nr:hypothetical protein [Spirochaetota bacterium]HOM37811.1 hypothetical protein [Spirochaetota bacterium]HPQ49312.1 hypothetical protein [Spirochaetota bacterium]